MKASNFFRLFLLFVWWPAVAGHAQDTPPPKRYWYTVYVSRVNGNEQFTGSSVYDEDNFARLVQGTRPIKLEDLRYSLSNTADAKWAPGGYVGNPSAIFILPRNILYYVQYPAEPPLRDKAGQTAP